MKHAKINALVEAIDQLDFQLHALELAARTKKNRVTFAGDRISGARASLIEAREDLEEERRLKNGPPLKRMTTLDNEPL